MVPNTSSCPRSWKPVPRDWQYLHQGTTHEPVLHAPSHVPATDSFPWHLTKSSLEVSVLVYHDAAHLFPPLTSLLISALLPLQQPSAPHPHLSPLQQQTSPPPVPSATGDGRGKRLGKGITPAPRPLHHSCWPWSGLCPDLGISPPAHVPPQDGYSLFICAISLAFCSPKTFSFREHTQLTQLAMLCCSLLQFIAIHCLFKSLMV